MKTDPTKTPKTTECGHSISNLEIRQLWLHIRKVYRELRKLKDAPRNGNQPKPPCSIEELRPEIDKTVRSLIQAIFNRTGPSTDTFIAMGDRGVTWFFPEKRPAREVDDIQYLATAAESAFATVRFREDVFTGAPLQIPKTYNKGFDYMNTVLSRPSPDSVNLLAITIGIKNSKCLTDYYWLLRNPAGKRIIDDKLLNRPQSAGGPDNLPFQVTPQNAIGRRHARDLLQPKLAQGNVFSLRGFFPLIESAPNPANAAKASGDCYGTSL